VVLGVRVREAFGERPRVGWVIGMDSDGDTIDVRWDGDGARSALGKHQVRVVPNDYGQDPQRERDGLDRLLEDVQASESATDGAGMNTDENPAPRKQSYSQWLSNLRSLMTRNGDEMTLPTAREECPLADRLKGLYVDGRTPAQARRLLITPADAEQAPAADLPVDDDRLLGLSADETDGDGQDAGEVAA
jgi:hypothetical protein